MDHLPIFPQLGHNIPERQSESPNTCSARRSFPKLDDIPVHPKLGKRLPILTVLEHHLVVHTVLEHHLLVHTVLEHHLLVHTALAYRLPISPKLHL